MNTQTISRTEKAESLEANIGITDKNKKIVTAILNKVLADEYVLYTKTRNFHWNVVSPSFSELHKFFEKQYEELNEIIDQVAERSRAIGGTAKATLKEFIETSNLKEQPGHLPSADGMIKALLADQESVIRELRDNLQETESAGDMGTTDFLTGLMQQHETMAWMLRSYLG